MEMQILSIDFVLLIVLEVHLLIRYQCCVLKFALLLLPILDTKEIGLAYKHALAIFGQILLQENALQAALQISD